MKAPRPWHETFTDLMAYMRGRGWKCPFILHGQKLHPIGMIGGAGMRRRVCNDNARRRKL